MLLRIKSVSFSSISRSLKLKNYSAPNNNPSLIPRILSRNTAASSNYKSLAACCMAFSSLAISLIASSSLWISPTLTLFLPFRRPLIFPISPTLPSQSVPYFYPGSVRRWCGNAGECRWRRNGNPDCCFLYSANLLALRLWRWLRRWWWRNRPR